MADQNEQNQPSGAELLDQERTSESLSRMRAIANLGEAADGYITDRVHSIMRKEIEEFGESPTHKLWEESKSNPDAERKWRQREAELAYEVRRDTEAFQRRAPEVRCQQIPADILKGRHSSELSESELDQARKALQRENDLKAARQYRRDRGIPE